MANNILKEFSAESGKRFQLMDADGKVSKAFDLPDETLLTGLKSMLRARVVDEMAVSYQRQGRMYTYPPNLGQEAIPGAAGAVMRESDWLVPAYREAGAWFAKGMTLEEFFLYWSGYEEGGAAHSAQNMLPPAVPIASQLLHAVGISYANKFRNRESVAFAFVGDGGTSQGDFHEAMNFAAVWNVPVVFVVQNNGYAISCPTSKQTRSESIAIKSLAYGLKGIQVDGNDYAACLRTFEATREHAISGEGPVLVEAMTYRIGAHTTSDDPSRYREASEEEAWKDKDPLRRLRLYLQEKELWNDDEEARLVAEFKAEVDAEFKKVEGRAYPLENVFKYHYAEMPDELKSQMAEYEKFQRNGGAA